MTPDVVQNPEIGALVSPDSLLRPHFDTLAENLGALDQELRSVVVTGPEPGAGCSSVCVGLGAALVGAGRTTAVVDCNLDRPCLHRLFGEPNFLGLSTALEGERPLKECGFEAAPGLLVVPTGPVPPDPSALLESGRFVDAVRGLGESRDTVLLDAPVASRILESPAFSGGFDGVLLVVHATRSSKNVAREVTDDLLDAEVNLLGVVLNGCL